MLDQYYMYPVYKTLKLSLGVDDLEPLTQFQNCWRP